MSIDVLMLAEGSRTLGAGHQVRSAVLARALVSLGLRPLLLARALPGAHHGWAWSGLAYELAPPDQSLPTLLDNALAQFRPTTVVIDHYDVDAATLARIAAQVALAVIEDVPGRRLPASMLVINHGVGLRPADYPDHVTALGPAYALIRPDFTTVSARPSEGAPVLVLLGATDVAGLAPAVCAQLLAQDERVIAVTAPRDDAALATLARAHGARLTWHQGLDAPALAAVMAACSAAVLSASTVVYEAAAVGLPAVCLHTAANQDRLAQALTAAGVLVRAPEQLGALAEDLRRVRRVGPILTITGGGPARVAARVHEHTVLTVPSLRAAAWADLGMLLAWANDAATRAASFTPTAIEHTAHARWLERQLMNPDSRLWLVEDQGERWGTLRLHREGAQAAEATVSITVAPEQRGRGRAVPMLHALTAWTRRSRFAQRLSAWVRHDNPASLTVFTRAGYTKREERMVLGHLATRFEIGTT